MLILPRVGTWTTSQLQVPNEIILSFYVLIQHQHTDSAEKACIY